MIQMDRKLIQIHIERIQLLYRDRFVPAILSTVASSLLVAILCLTANRDHWPIWLGILIILTIAHMIFLVSFKQKTVNGKLHFADGLSQVNAHAGNMMSTGSVTALNNRRAFFDKARLLFDDCLRQRQRLSAVMMDVDHFKNINDTYGHAAGDLVLDSLSNLLEGNLRDSDLLCRFGGEGFAIVLPNTDVKEAEKLANQFRMRMMKNNIKLDCGDEISLTASFGVANAGDSLEDLLTNADQAMYTAKYHGRNQVTVFDRSVANFNKSKLYA